MNPTDDPMRFVSRAAFNAHPAIVTARVIRLPEAPWWRRLFGSPAAFRVELVVKEELAAKHIPQVVRAIRRYASEELRAAVDVVWERP